MERDVGDRLNRMTVGVSVGVLRGEKVPVYGISEGALGIEGEPKGEIGRPWGDGVYRYGRTTGRDRERGWLYVPVPATIAVVSKQGLLLVLVKLVEVVGLGLGSR
jgi:hypothetical protein